MTYRRRYKNLLSHLQYHNARGWLERGVNDEKARTIGEALSHLSDGQLNRRLARMLARR